MTASLPGFIGPGSSERASTCSMLSRNDGAGAAIVVIQRRATGKRNEWNCILSPTCRCLNGSALYRAVKQDNEWGRRPLHDALASPKKGSENEWLIKRCRGKKMADLGRWGCCKRTINALKMEAEWNN